jgi:hypothetical protein
MARKFASKKQWRWAFANRKTWAHRWAHRNQRSKPYGVLPRSKGAGKGRRAR